MWGCRSVHQNQPPADRSRCDARLLEAHPTEKESKLARPIYSKDAFTFAASKGNMKNPIATI